MADQNQDIQNFRSSLESQFNPGAGINYMIPNQMIPQQPQQPMGAAPMQPQQPQQPQPRIEMRDYAAGAYPKTTLDPTKYLGLNPYALLSYPGISALGFRQEQNADKKIGAVQEKAQSELGSEQGDISKVQSELNSNLMKKSIENEYNYKRNSADFENQIDAATQAYPSLSRAQVIKTYTTGQKLAAGLGIILGGIGQGMMHSSSNQALDQFNAGVDSVIKANNDNFNKQFQAIMSKQQKTAQDFQVGRQLLDDNSKMMNNTLEGLKAQAQANFVKATAPVQKLAALKAASEVEQKLAAFRQETALQNFTLKMQENGWAASQIYNDLNVNAGIDSKTNTNVTGRATSKEAADLLRKEIPVLDNKINALAALNNYISHNSIKEDAFSGQNLKAFKTMIEQTYGFKPGELPDPIPTLGRNATDFYQNMLGEAIIQKQSLLRQNTQQERSSPTTLPPIPMKKR